MTDENPIYKFALREDLKDKKQFLPTKAKILDTGWDVRAAMPDQEPLVIKPFDIITIPLGFRAFCPEGWWFELKPRSSSFTKRNLNCLIGTIDETYEGELLFACQYLPPLSNINTTGKLKLPNISVVNFLSNLSQTLTINFGDAIGQIIPVKRQEMEVVELTNEEIDALYLARGADRGTGGFGSTDGYGNNDGYSLSDGYNG